MTGYTSKRQVALDKMEDDDAQGYIAQFEEALQKEYQRGYDAGKASQPEQEPVALVVSTAPDRIWLDLGFDPQDEYEVIFHELHDVTWSQDNASGNGIEYVRADTTPPKRPWVGLTDEDTFKIAERLGLSDVAWVDLMQAIEAKLKEKNT